MKNVIQFILVSDVTRARYLRRLIADKKTAVGVVVGTFTSLLSHVKDACFLPALNPDWDKQFHEMLESQNAFWSESYQVAPDETSKIIKQALVNLITALPISSDFNLENTDQLSLRPRNHLSDLIQLYNSLNKTLGDDYELLRQCIQSDSQKALRKLHIHLDGSVNKLTLWQQLLIDKINSDSSEEEHADYSTYLHPESVKNNGNALSALQNQVFDHVSISCELDESIQFVGLRDFMEEADVAAGMIQEILKEHDGLSESDIGLLIPDDFEYSLAVEDAFIRAGLPLSGFSSDSWRRDLAQEALFHFLYCRQKPAPLMALSVCLSSTLMPWSREEGAHLAQQIMDGDYRLKPFTSASDKSRSMLKLIKEGDDTSSSLQQALREFVGLLDDHEQFSEHLNQARKTVDILCGLLEGVSDIPWKLLRRATTPKYIRNSPEAEYSLEGITVWRENQNPWRRVRYLLVLGFSEGHYPTSIGTSSVFSLDDLSQLKQHCGIEMITSDDVLAQRRGVFKQQLSYVIDFISFLIPRRNPAGDAQAPSDSLVFMSPIFGSLENKVLELDAHFDRDQIRYLAHAVEAMPTHPRTIESKDIQLGQNLLHLRTDQEGNPKPESPSGLETMMVSPLAWALRRLGVQSKGWAPEEFDVLIQGTLAHYVFEKLFTPGSELPDKETIDSQSKVILDEGILKCAPYLRSNQWQIERANLLSGIVKAAHAWSQILSSLNAEVLGCEQWLKGQFAGIAIHGQADAIIKLSDGQLIMVDYKRSSSKSREPRMAKAYDSQAYLYIAMLNSKESINKDNEVLYKYFEESDTPGIVYYMLNDQTALSDFSNAQTQQVAGWDYVSKDVSSHAIDLIHTRLDEIKAGTIMLNRQGDEHFFDKESGIKPYALEDSPLISMFTLEDDVEEVE